MPEPRRTFAPVLLVGLASATLCAVAGTKPWARVTDSDAPGSTADVAHVVRRRRPDARGGRAEPGRARRLGSRAGHAGVGPPGRHRARRRWRPLGVVAAVVVGYSSTQDDVADSVRQIGATSVDTAPTGWFWAAAVSSVVSLVATVLAVRYVRALARDGQPVRRALGAAGTDRRPRRGGRRRAVARHRRGPRPHGVSGALDCPATYPGTGTNRARGAPACLTTTATPRQPGPRSSWG